MKEEKSDEARFSGVLWEGNADKHSIDAVVVILVDEIISVLEVSGGVERERSIRVADWLRCREF